LFCHAVTIGDGVLHSLARGGHTQLKILVLGLGNPILTDDAVGIIVAEEVRRRLDREDVAVDQASVGGLGLLELILGYDRVIIVDAIQTEAGQPGQVHRFSPDQFRGNLRAASPHDVTLATALELGRRLRKDIPKEIVIFAVEAADTETFGEELTPAVAAAVPEVVELVLQELERRGNRQRRPRCPAAR
jgi:hydrogenase maturation protease